jgi:hypothetical protein
MQIGKCGVKFVRKISWIERCTGCPSGNGEKGYSHLRALRQHKGNAVIAAQPHGIQSFQDVNDVKM